MKQRVVVIGLGIFGINLVKELCASGVEVIAIDKTKEAVQKARDCATKAIVADGTDRKSWRRSASGRTTSSSSPSGRTWRRAP